MADEWDNEVTNTPTVPASNGFQPIKPDAKSTVSNFLQPNFTGCCISE
jgi:hypothetical protein